MKPIKGKISEVLSDIIVDTGPLSRTTIEHAKPVLNDSNKIRKPQKTQTAGSTTPPNGTALLPKVAPRPQVLDGAFWPNFLVNYDTQGIVRRYAFYIGCWFEVRGWQVEYCDINTLMPYLICRKGDRIVVILCRASTVHKNSIYYLTGIAAECKKNNPACRVSGILCTPVSLNNSARITARTLNIAFREKFQFDDFPYVKCKIDSNGNRVHYTPLDNQYLTAVIRPGTAEMFCWTEQQAINLGF